MDTRTRAEMRLPQRLYRHLWAGEREARRAFPAATLARVEQIVAQSETQHRGELRIVIEGGFGWHALRLPNRTRDAHGDAAMYSPSRVRAVDLFSRLRVWDTADNSGVLIYILMAERKLEIVADRGIHAKVDESVWQAIAAQATLRFREAAFEAGLEAVVGATTALLATHFPPGLDNPNELPDGPVRL